MRHQMPGLLQTLLALGALRATLGSVAKAPAHKGSVKVEVANPLASLDPVRVGYVRWVNLSDGRSAQVRTLAVRPPLFYIAGFLSSEESEALIDEARGKSTAGSVMGGTSPRELSDNIQRKENKRSFMQFTKMFRYFDKDRNGALDKTELGRLLHNVYDLPNHDHTLFMKRYNCTSLIRMQDLFGLNLAKYREWIMKDHPHMMERHSDQVWLEYSSDKTQPLIDRAQRITGLPKAIVSGESPLQVLHYGKWGHYSCHYDSPPSHIPDGNVVRLGTMAVFLNEPEAGGQIAFPGADKPGSDKWNVSGWANLKYECQATDRCTTLGGVVVSPKKGDAVLWYNMKPNHWSTNSTGDLQYQWDGKTDDSFNWHSLHCGAEVSKGEKWMANIWFRTHPKNPKRAQVQSTIEAPSTILI